MSVAWDPEVLQRVGMLHLRARTLTDELMVGGHRSRRAGVAVEFADYQEYVPGMDLRHLDWRVLARSDRAVLRRYETETQLPCTVVLDLSGDLGTGTRGAGGLPALEGSKAGTAITLAATLLYWFHRHGEPIGLEVVAGEGVPFPSVPPRRGRKHLQMLFACLAAARPGGRASLRSALVRVGSRVRRRSLVTLISDGMEEPSEWLPALGTLARRGVDLRMVHLFDRGEWGLDTGRPMRFYSPEGGEALSVDPAGVRHAFTQVVDEYVDEVRGGVVRWGGYYALTATDEPLERVIRRIVRVPVGQEEVRWR